MKSIGCLLLVSLLAGCGSSSTRDKTQSNEKKTTPKGEQAESSAKSRRRHAQPPKVKVPADAYAGIPQAIDALCQAAASDDGGEIVRTCTWLKMQGNDAVQPLGELLYDESTPTVIRYHVCRALAEIGGPGVALLIDQLDTDSDEVRWGIINSLGRVETADQAINDLIAHALLEQARKDKTRDTRRRALLALANLGEPAGKVAKDTLIQLVQETDDQVIRAAASKALTAVAPRRTFVDD